jgi:hypothetical protein
MHSAFRQHGDPDGSRTEAEEEGFEPSTQVIPM